MRNADGVTPLLMACRVGREEKILALLHLNVDVDLVYAGGETPLHWLGLLPDPTRVLEEFLLRGADINAQVTQERALPSFLGGLKSFYVKGPPLNWAMAMGNEIYVDALLKKGADINMLVLDKVTPVRFACFPGRSQFLDRFSRQPEFKVSREDASSVMTLWSDLRILNNYAKPKEQERALKLLLSTPIPFRDWAEVDAFYQYPVSEAVSECRREILEIVLNGLSKSMATIKDADPSSLKHAKLPLSYPAWVEHRLVHEAAVRGDPKILHIVLDYGGDATSMDGFQRSTLHLLSVFSNNAESAGILLDHGAHSLLDHRTELDGMTAFMTAVANCNFAVADRLLRKTPT